MSNSKAVLPGLVDPQWRATFVAQIISSLRRIEYVQQIARRDISADRCDPHQNAFDPIKGAALRARQGALDEAVWMTFIGTQFGKHIDDGWKLASNVMGSFGHGPIWTAARYGHAPHQFEAMLNANSVQLNDKNLSGRYSNHRQYQSKKPQSIAATFASFHSWQFAQGSFARLIRAVHEQHGQEATSTFDALYKSLDAVAGFGRLGKFDFLTMLGKLDLAPIEPGSVYLVGATGPLAGARLLFHGDRSFRIAAKALEASVDMLDDYLHTGKQVLEDSLCNWQKRPEKYEYFRG
ncbi:hypothetical protein PY365_18885 [Roseiarcaceae bacterium H3SJ34-1]|uniref:alpha-glutamyl/putrescinyl thymine pyrophosphorylase clade 3 protein n=1 Tax=Terripilifer ovatus TaxID=3032367 RepID=UPI003AB9A15B|nr:hypothetical protein [Roseiarcaceae bacterium H3SJ34-1]